MPHTNHDKIDGVSCTVKNCIHHCEINECDAGHIRVGTEYANEKTETVCGTFEAR